MSDKEMKEFVISAYKKANPQQKAIIAGFATGVAISFEKHIEEMENQQQRQGVVK